MHVVVCVKQILNPEIAQSLFRVDESAKKVIPVPGMSMVMNPFDEQAVEGALRLRDRSGDVRITVVSLGAETARAVIKAALALGADEGILLSDLAFAESDSYTTALALARAIDKLRPFDLVLTGRQAADWDVGVVGCGLAELLELPAITFAKDVSVADGRLRVERVLSDGVEIVESSLPAVVTIAHELGKPRYASLRETMRAARKPIVTWNPADLGLAASEIGAAGARHVRERLYIPPRDIQCEFVGGNSPQEAAANLAQRLRHAKLI